MLVISRMDYEQDNKKLEPKKIFDEYEKGKSFKNNIGHLGLYEQVKRNERMMLGDHWYGVNAGDLPTPVINVIKQIGDYKVANITSNPLTANYSFEGVPSSQEAIDYKVVMSNIAPPAIAGQSNPETDKETERIAVSQALSGHFSAAWERLQMDKMSQTGVRKAYSSGTLIYYSWFDPNLRTGLYATDKKTPTKGDIKGEILDVTNVYFGEPTNTDVQSQPYILISQRKPINQLKREARINKRPQQDINSIIADTETQYEAGYDINTDQEICKKATVLTRFWKEYQDDGTYIIKSIKTCKTCVIRDEYDTGLSLYPFAVFQWDEMDNCIYGHSEVTELTPNQIAINRMKALNIMSEMYMGMPKIIYNEDVITEEITNAPGQVIGVTGNEDVAGALRMVTPPTISASWENAVQGLIDNTKTIAGATAAALGDIRPENTSAIVAVREAATAPLQTVMMRYYAFVEDIARIWADMFIRKYGKRMLKVIEKGQISYVPFDGDRYKDDVLSVRIDVGPSSLWSISTLISTLNNMLNGGLLKPYQYVERLPDGFVTDKQSLVDDLKKQYEQEQQMKQQQLQIQMQGQQAQQGTEQTGQQSPNIDEVLSQLSDEQLAELSNNPELQQQLATQYQQ